MRLAFHRLTCYGLLRLVVQHEQMILSFIDAHGSINRTETIELCKLNLFQEKTLQNHNENETQKDLFTRFFMLLSKVFTPWKSCVNLVKVAYNLRLAKFRKNQYTMAIFEKAKNRCFYCNSANNSARFGLILLVIRPIIRPEVAIIRLAFDIFVRHNPIQDCAAYPRRRK